MSRIRGIDCNGVVSVLDLLRLLLDFLNMDTSSISWMVSEHMLREQVATTVGKPIAAHRRRH